MREPVKYYNGFDITEEVIRKINLIELKRLQEEITIFNSEPIETIYDLCLLHGTFPKEENVYLGTDWYIIYSKYDNDDIEINEWVAVGNVKNKLTQTIEMMNAMKKIIISAKNAKIFATMRHSTSYQFYQSLLSKGYLKEISNRPDIEEELPKNLSKIKDKLKTKYQMLEEYLQNSTSENLDKTHFNDYIYHLINFKITDKFVKKYQKTI